LGAISLPASGMPRPIGRRSSADAGAPPEWIRPQLTELVDATPEGDEWLHEIKFDGYRMHVRLNGGNVRMLTRTGLDWTYKYPAIARAVSSLAARQAYLDGELCGVYPDGITSFSMIQAASDADNAAGLVFFILDLLHLDDVGARPRIERKARIAELLADVRPPLHYSDYHRGHSPAFYDQACKLALEGIVSKRADAPYAPGNRGLWLKVKCLPPRIYRSGMDRSRRQAALARRVARLLRSRRKADLCRPRRHRYQHRRTRAAVAPPAAACY
jgi:ATP-dependent DNA ligase